MRICKDSALTCFLTTLQISNPTSLTKLLELVTGIEGAIILQFPILDQLMLILQLDFKFVFSQNHLGC